MHIVYPSKENDFVLSTNNFYSDEMKQYNNLSIDDWKSNERYQVAYSVLQQNKNQFSLNLAKNILCGKYGFIVLKETLVGEHLKKIVDLNFRKLNSISSIIFLNLAL